ncbi:hypothetical protein Tco_0377055 [Tanacetum coccineum]
MLHRFSGKILHIECEDCFEASMNREKFPEKIYYHSFTKAFQSLIRWIRFHVNLRTISMSGNAMLVAYDGDDRLERRWEWRWWCRLWGDDDGDGVEEGGGMEVTTVVASGGACGNAMLVAYDSDDGLERRWEWRWWCRLWGDDDGDGVEEGGGMEVTTVVASGGAWW